ncbi:MAG TPA: VWA domain-containing protein [Bryobacteraceae bacterium]|nr:VWA domain-containing protein [Bryobacteraceae bacterium]
MQRFRSLLLCLACAGLAIAADDTFVFTSDVALVRVDAQVVDRSNRAISGLQPEDFVLRENGTIQAIRHFGTEDTPLDVLFLIDVSGSMQSHVQDLADAARTAFGSLGAGDRVGVMVFDRSTRVRLPLQERSNGVRALNHLLQSETFDGGTDVTRGILDAAAYLAREGREDARRAIVILTDDQTERGKDERGAGAALARGNIVLSALLAPDAMGSGRMGGGWPPMGGGRPGGLGGIILRGPGSRFPGGGISMPRTQSAGTARIARESGGDSMRVDEAQALDTTLLRLRQRYALHFSLPEGVKPGDERDIEVELTAAAQRRHPGAEVRFRRMSQGGHSDVSSAAKRSPSPARSAPVTTPERSDAADVTLTPAPKAEESRKGGWRRADEQPAASDAAAGPPEPTEPAKKGGGWRRADGRP